MVDQAFSARSLLRLLRRGDPHKFGLGDSKAEYTKKLFEISNSINDKDFKFSRFCLSIRKHGKIFSPSKVTDEFALRKINDNIKRALNIKFSDRGKIVPQVITLLKESVPYYVVKLDIKRFYESIDRQILIERIATDSRLSFKTKSLLTELFESPQLKYTPGLPLGLSVSATLSEYYLDDFDAYCKRLNSCYFYARYVDDIIFFCHANPAGIEESLRRALPEGLKFNQEKCQILSVGKNGDCDAATGDTHLSFLGYDFLFRNSPRNTRRTLKVCIAEKKVKKIKTRIALSLFDFLRTADYPLLRQRIVFLTSNYVLKNDKASGRLYSGIFYNYQFIDVDALEALSDLDLFLMKSIYAKNGSLGKKLTARLTLEQKRDLCRHSFSSGYRDRIVKNFSHPDLKDIKAIWEHA